VCDLTQFLIFYFRVNLLASQYNKALNYARKSLEHLENIRGACPQAVQLRGYAHLWAGHSFIGLSNFKRAMEHLEKSLNAAQSQNDTALESLSCCALGTLYLELKDYEKVILQRNAFISTMAAVLRLQ